MAKVNLVIESQSDDGVVHAIVNGVKYIYSGMDCGVFKARQKSYKYKPGQLLNWLKKNSQKVVKVEDKPKPTKGKNNARKFSPIDITRAQRVIMIGKTHTLMKENNYFPIKKGKTVEGKWCPKCGKRTLIGCFSADKKVIIGICFRRFYPTKMYRCTYNKRWDIDNSPIFTAEVVKGV